MKKTTQNYKNSKTVLQELNAFYMIGARKPGQGEHIIVGIPEEGDEGYFSPYGCTILNNGLGTTVYDVDVIVAYYNKNGRYVELERHTESVCFEVLNAYHNGEDIEIDDDRRPINS